MLAFMRENKCNDMNTQENIMISATRPFIIASALAASAIGLSACMDTAVQETAAPAAVATASTADELRAMGAEQLTEDQIRTLVVGRTLDAGDWTYAINADGTWQAAAKDGSWADGPGTWEILDNQFCREAPGVVYECQSFYLLGNQLRVAAGDGTMLRPWTASI